MKKHFTQLIVLTLILALFACDDEADMDKNEPEDLEIIESNILWKWQYDMYKLNIDSYE